MRRRTFLCSLAALGVALAAAPTAPAAPQLDSRITIAKASLTTADEVMIGFSLGNAGDRSARVLRWQTPLYGVDDNLFEVARDGERVAYLGRHVRRPAPRPSDYVWIRPGEVLTATVALSSLYDFSKPGRYTVRYRVRTFDPGARGLGEALVDLVKSDLLTLTLEGDDLSEPPRGVSEQAPGEQEVPGPKFLAPRFQSCSTSRRNTIRGALSGAHGQTDSSLSYMNSGQTGSRYTSWFGRYSSSRYQTVRSTFAKIDDALRNKTLTFDCSCTEDFYAYVYSDDPYVIYLCNVFWGASAADKAGTITHELSHFNVVAGTSDWAYGVSACQALARQSPAQAVDNADNVAYFGY